MGRLAADLPSSGRAVRRRHDVNTLYRTHPAIRSYVVRQVTYTPATRDKVLRVCHAGALVKTAKQREATRVFACAPLIFFFYRYGRDKSVAESLELARRLYWYGSAIPGPFDARRALTEVLEGWGVH
jgi:hypothetical protein